MEELIPKSSGSGSLPKGFLAFPGCSQELRALFQPWILTALTQIPSAPWHSHRARGFSQPQARDGAEDVTLEPQNPNPKLCLLGDTLGML